tara:strand:- start:387 stop:578 length:192 start_codon:yes stop_codon:yes gene_type:complete
MNNYLKILTIMSKKKGKTRVKLAILNEINHTDKRMKRFKNDPEELDKLMSKRNSLRSKLKTKR